MKECSNGVQVMRDETLAARGRLSNGTVQNSTVAADDKKRRKKPPLAETNARANAMQSRRNFLNVNVLRRQGGWAPMRFSMCNTFARAAQHALGRGAATEIGKRARACLSQTVRQSGRWATHRARANTAGWPC